MSTPAPRPGALEPALQRLHALAPLDDAATEALLAAMGQAHGVKARRELLTEREPIDQPLLLLDGWAAQVRILLDGRRQFIGFLLPGDIIGHCGFAGALATSTVATLSDVRICPLPDEGDRPDLHRAYAISRAMGEAHLMAQVTRLGRFDAHERILDLLLELHDRLALAGLAGRGRFSMPLTQELLADALGLTSVHVNRTVQVARRRGELAWTGRLVELGTLDALRQQLGRPGVRVTRD